MTLNLILERGSPHAWRSPVTWSKAIGSVAVGLGLGVLLLLWVSTHFLGYAIETIGSGSMQPALSRGDVILTRPVAIGDVKAGDIVTFDEGRDVHLTIAHRVQSVINVSTTIENTSTGEVTTESSRLLHTKGDANASTDVAPVDAAHLRGEVMFTIPKVGLIMDRIPLQYLFVAAFLLTGAGWGAYEFLRYRRRMNDHRTAGAA